MGADRESFRLGTMQWLLGTEEEGCFLLGNVHWAHLQQLGAP